MLSQLIAQKDGFLDGTDSELKVKQEGENVIFEFALPIIEENS